MHEQTELNRDALYAAWSEDRSAPSPRPLRDWLNDYPAAQDDLLEWTAAAPLIAHAATLQEDAEGDARAAEIAARALTAFMANVSLPLPGLYEPAQRQGLSPRALAERLGVGIPIVAKLHQRLIRAATVPEPLIALLAEALQVRGEQIRAYLALAPTLARGAAYKAENAPTVAEPEDFGAAVRACPGMTEDQKALWIARMPE